MSKEYSKQHIVPKCYLDRFATKSSGKDRYIIGTCTIESGRLKLFEHATTEVGYIRDFYDVTDKDDPKYWEHYFAEKIDTLCDKKLASIISSIHLSEKSYVLGYPEKIVLSTIIIAQLLRVPDSFNYVYNHIVPHAIDEVKSQLKKIPFRQNANQKQRIINNYQLPKVLQKEIYLNSSFDENRFNRYVELLAHRMWLVYINTISNEIPFITSDNPVLVENLSQSDSLGIFQNGLINPKTCFFFPLTPSIAIANYSDRGFFSPLASELDGHIYRISEAEYIIERNNLLMNQAYNHFFIPQPLFDFTRNREPSDD